MTSNVVLPFDGDFATLRAKLEAWGFEVGERPNAPLFARGHGVTLHAYRTGKLMVSGSRAQEWAAELRARFPAPATAPPAAGPDPELPASVTRGVRAGVDEAGKGDYFGPLVIAGVVVDDALAAGLRSRGVRDSKRLPDEQVLRLADEVRALLGASRIETIALPPERYNALRREMGSVNRILGWAHARAIEALLGRHPECKAALSDQFGDERHIRERLGQRGRTIALVQSPRAEREVAVAAASVVARAEFVLAVRLMSARHDFRFPLGATHVEDAARAFLSTRPDGALARVAKLHFRTTERVVPEPERRARIEASLDEG